MEDKNMQMPYTTNQIKSEKPNAPRTEALLSGEIANSFNAGHNTTIQYKHVLAGEFHKEMRVRLHIQLLTPRTPAYQKLKCTARCYFVPNERVHKNYMKFVAQRGGTTEDKITELPNFGGKIIPKVISEDGTAKTLITNTTLFRDGFVKSYLPRVGELADSFPNIDYVMPKYSALPLRGRIAIYNDWERNKEFDPIATEYDDDTVSEEEWQSYFPNTSGTQDLTIYNMRAKKDNSYYSDYRTDIQGFASEIPTNLQGNESLVRWADWEAKIAEARSQAENAQKRDEEILQELRGSKLLTEGRVMLIGRKTFDINYSAVTQSAYNTNEEITEEFQVMGKQGAYSYTEVDIPVYAGMVFNEDGIVHIIVNVSADTVYESSFDRLDLNVSALDQYRPDLEGEKFDILKEIEMGNYGLRPREENLAAGYKRKFSEYFKMRNTIAGDMTSLNYFQFDYDKLFANQGIDLSKQIITQKTYQFYEVSSTIHVNSDGSLNFKKPWKDYTDLLLNKNQAIENKVWQRIGNGQVNEGFSEIMVEGQNQIFFAGKCYCMAILPINGEIAPNYTKWGEH